MVDFFRETTRDESVQSSSMSGGGQLLDMYCYNEDGWMEPIFSSTAEDEQWQA